MKYTDLAGAIELDILLVKKGEKIGEKQVDRNGILIKVGDNGWGIPENQKKRIFEKLFRADNVKEKETEGTGLGLYIVRSIVEAASGLVWFDSKEGVGSTFFVMFPLAGMLKKEGKINS